VDQPFEELPALPRLALWNGLFYEPYGRMKPPPEFAAAPPVPVPEPDPELAPEPERRRLAPEPDAAVPTRAVRLAPELQEWLGGAPARKAPPGYAYEFGTGRVVPALHLPTQIQSHVVTIKS
jgi:hypothetical protein